MPDNFGFWDTIGDFVGGVIGIGGNGDNGGGSSNLAGKLGQFTGARVDQAFFGMDRDGTPDYNPFPDADDLPSAPMGNGCNLQVMVAPMQKVINKAPRGYVIVEHPNTGVKVAMLKAVAKSCGLWKPRAKPVMTAADAKTIRKAARLTGKVDRLAKLANSVTGKAPLRRVRTSKKC